MVSPAGLNVRKIDSDGCNRGCLYCNLRLLCADHLRSEHFYNLRSINNLHWFPLLALSLLLGLGKVLKARVVNC